MKRFIVWGLVACGGAALAQAPSASLPDVLAGKAFPLTRTLGSLDATWLRVRIAGTSDAAGATQGMMSMFAGVEAPAFYTRGETVPIGGETFVLAYRVQTTGPDLAALMREDSSPGAAKYPAKPPLTADSALALALVNLRNIGSLSDIRPFDLAREVAEGGKPTSLLDVMAMAEQKRDDQSKGLNNLQQMARAALTWADKHGKTLPSMKDAAAIEKALAPQLPLFVFKDPATGEAYLANPRCSGAKLASVKKPAETILFYQGKPDDSGRRAAAFVDGHVQLLPADRFAALMKN